MVTLGCSEAEGVLLLLVEEEAVVSGVLGAARSRGSTGAVGFCGGLVPDGRSVAMATSAPLFLRFNRSVEEEEEDGGEAVEEAVVVVVVVLVVFGAAVVAVAVVAAAVGGCVAMTGTFIAFRKSNGSLQAGDGREHENDVERD